MKAFSVTNIGMIRKVNQDYVFASEVPVGSLPNLFIVADGMGGHRAGEHASKCCVESIVKEIKKAHFKSTVSMLDAAIQKANELVLAESHKKPEYEGMGTTVVAATIVEYVLHVGNIGDSRLYVIRDEIYQITEDHSLVETMVKTGEIMRKDVKHHPNKNIITRALGTNKNVKADFFEVSLKKGDIILLCSDGLSNMLDDSEIKAVVREGRDVQQSAMELVKRANEHGGTDNIGIVLIIM